MKSVFLTITVLNFFLTGSLFAQSSPESSTAQPSFQRTQSIDLKTQDERYIERLTNELKLSPQQEALLKSITIDYKQRLQKRVTENRLAHKELREAMNSDASEQKLRNLFQNVQTQRNYIALLRFEQAIEIRKMLTPAQRLLFANFESKIKKAPDKLKIPDLAPQTKTTE